MRITTHGNDLLVTDQSLGVGAFLVTVGALLMATTASRLLGDEPFAAMTFVSAVAGGLGIKLGMDRLAATQLIIDPDEKLIVTKRWSVLGTDVQRIPFEAVLGFSITPTDKDTGTVLMVQTTRGDVEALAGVQAVRQAWDEVVLAITQHMGWHPPSNRPGE